MRGRNGSRRSHTRDQEQLSHAAYTLQSGPGAGAEYHRALVEALPRPVQAFLREGQSRYLLAAIRERRSHAALLGRRLRDSVLRLGNEARQADAVLRR